MSGVVLDLRGVTFRRGGTDILHGIDLTVRAGERWALLGPNGAGKSTVLGFCGAVTHPTTGTAHVLGHRLGRVELQALRRRIGHVNPRLPVRPDLTVTDVVLTGFTGTNATVMRWEPTAEQVRTALDLVEEVGLTSRKDALWPVLSQGERGRALIARALVAAPELVLLDEPTTGLDVAAREQFLETVDGLALREPALTTVLVTHHLEELPTTTTHACVLAHGAVVAAGVVGDVLTTAVVSRAFEHPIEVAQERGRWTARAARRAAEVS